MAPWGSTVSSMPAPGRNRSSSVCVPYTAVRTLCVGLGLSHAAGNTQYAIIWLVYILPEEKSEQTCAQINVRLYNNHSHHQYLSKLDSAHARMQRELTTRHTLCRTTRGGTALERNGRSIKSRSDLLSVEEQYAGGRRRRVGQEVDEQVGAARGDEEVTLGHHHRDDRRRASGVAHKELPVVQAPCEERAWLGL